VALACAWLGTWSALRGVHRRAEAFVAALPQHP
jgi:hypothetical protein